MGTGGPERCGASPKGIVSSSPRVARHELPWIQVAKNHQPLRGCGLVYSPDDATPVGLGIQTRRFPRVARASQPRALSRNPGGILHAPVAEQRGTEDGSIRAMKIELTPRHPRYFDEKVKSGAYGSRDEVVREGLRLLEAGGERSRRLA